MEIFLEYNSDDARIKHALTVSGVMRHFAALYGEDEEKWSVIGLLHDIDYEKYPDRHCKKCIEIMRGKGIDEEYIHAVCSHGYGICSDTEPMEKMEKVLYTIDELTGLIGAVVIMRQSKSVQDLELKSVRKKYKSKGFAAGCSREVIERGADMLGWSLDELIERTIEALRTFRD